MRVRVGKAASTLGMRLVTAVAADAQASAASAGLPVDDGEVGLFEAGWPDFESGQAEAVPLGEVGQFPQRAGDVGAADEQRAAVRLEVRGEPRGQGTGGARVLEHVPDGGRAGLRP